MIAARKPARRLTWTDPRVILALGAALILAALALLAATQDRFSPSEHDFALPSLADQGVQIALADYRGHYVLVNFWATWCPPCREEMPDLQAYYDAHRAQGFMLLAVNEAEDVLTVRQYVAQRGFTFPVALDFSGAVMTQYGTESLPTSFLIGPDGRLVKAWAPGRLSRAALERDVTPLLKS